LRKVCDCSLALVCPPAAVSPTALRSGRIHVKRLRKPGPPAAAAPAAADVCQPQRQPVSSASAGAVQRRPVLAARGRRRGAETTVGGVSASPSGAARTRRLPLRRRGFARRPVPTSFQCSFPPTAPFLPGADCLRITGHFGTSGAVRSRHRNVVTRPSRASWFVCRLLRPGRTHDGPARRAESVHSPTTLLLELFNMLH
jgi:hypothetical protein